MTDAETPLNPAQQEVLDLLGASPEDRPTFAPTLKATLRADLEDALADLADEISPDAPMFVNKHDLSMVHGCERRHLAEKETPFEWSPPLARGTIAHKAIELSMHQRSRPIPLLLVDEAMDRLERSEDSISQWLTTCSESDRAELRAFANERVATFLECFPPMKAGWSPVTEARMRVELLDHRIVISGRSDLTLGRADGLTAGKVIIDFKTGSMSPSHLDDLRLYALLETLRIGTPPRLAASYYLDAGVAQADAITEAVLHSAVARTADGIRKLHELSVGTRAPVLRPSWGCRWCPIRTECEAGKAHLGVLENESDADRFDED
ncbi:MAG: PD-(D/E)XK nuclease family protein [Acidimicrobiales bacterium]